MASSSNTIAQLACESASPTVLVTRPQLAIAVSDAARLDERIPATLSRRRDSITDLYRPLDPNNEELFIAQEAYKQALLFCKEELKRDSKEWDMWLNSSTSASDVIDILKHARKNYESKSKPQSKAGSVWSVLSSRIGHYQDILDVLVQQQPEYVSLAWGALKFLFVVTLNHKELATKIAQAFSDIGGLLPRVEGIAKLYPNKYVKLAVADIYAQILIFCKKATKWYKRNKLMHMVVAFTKPWTLEFQDVVDNIKHHAQKITDLSVAASQAELRDMHVTLRKTEKTLIEMAYRNNATQFQRLPTFVASQDAFKKPFAIESVAKYFSSNMLNPEENLRIGSALRDRGRVKSAGNFSSIWLSRDLQEWASESASSVLRVNGSIIRTDKSRDFAVDMIRLATTLKIPVIWSFDWMMSSKGREISTEEVLKSLIQQLLHQRPEIFTGASDVNESEFQQCTTVENWRKLFLELLRRIPRVLIILDATEQLAQAVNEIGEFWQGLNTQNALAMVKVVIIKYENKYATLSSSGNNGTNIFNLALNDGQRPGAGRRPVARQRSRVGFKRTGPEHLGPFLRGSLGSIQV